MEEFLVQNAKRYQALVKAFKPGASTQTSTLANASTSPDIVVSTRIRPLSDEEASAGFSDSVFTREAQPGVVDVHELRRPVRGLPTLKVRILEQCFLTSSTNRIEGDQVCVTKICVTSLLSTRWTECSAPMQRLRMFTTWCHTLSPLRVLGVLEPYLRMGRLGLARRSLSVAWRRWSCEH